CALDRIGFDEIRRMVTFRSTIPRAALVFLLTIPSLSIAAQLAKVIRRAEPIPTPEARPSNWTDTKPSFVGDDASDKYKVVFPIGYERLPHKPKDPKEEERAIYSQRANFIEQLNKAGALGYRLVASVDTYPVAVVKLDKAQYEYAWFETISETILQQ